jgi:hypothetical protein
MTKTMNLETIKSRAKKPAKTVEAWGTTFHLRTLSAADVDTVELRAGKDDNARRVEWLVFGLTDETGARPFDNDDARAWLRGDNEADRADGWTVSQLFGEICEYNNVRGVEATAKN